MQLVTPFSFIYSFIGKLDHGVQSHIDRRFLILKSSQLILSLIKGIDFLELHPSEIAAVSISISVVGIGFEKTQISPIFEHAKKVFDGRVFKSCMEVVSRGCTRSFGSGTMTSF